MTTQLDDFTGHSREYIKRHYGNPFIRVPYTEGCGFSCWQWQDINVSTLFENGVLSDAYTYTLVDGNIWAEPRDNDDAGRAMAEYDHIK